MEELRKWTAELFFTSWAAPELQKWFFFNTDLTYSFKVNYENSFEKHKSAAFGYSDVDILFGRPDNEQSEVCRCVFL